MTKNAIKWTDKRYWLPKLMGKICAIKGHILGPEMWSADRSWMIKECQRCGQLKTQIRPPPKTITIGEGGVD